MDANLKKASRRTITDLLDCQRRVLERIASGAPLSAILLTLVTLVERLAAEMRCAILLRDSSGKRLEFVAAANIPDDFKACKAPFLGIGPDMGNCGRAAFRGEPVYTEDIALDARWVHCRDVALRNGIRAAWSTPVLSDDNVVLGTFTMFYGEPGLPAREHVQLIDMAVQMARVAIEAKRADDAFRRSEDRLRLVIDTIPAMAWTVTPGGAVDFVNRRWLEYSGLSLKEALEQPTRTLHPDDVARVVENWSADMAAGRPYEDEMRLRRVDGEYRWFLVRTMPLRGEQGQITKWYGSGVDIEARKQAEEAVRRSEREFRDVIETIPAIAWTARPDGSNEFTNRSWQEYTGLSVEETAGSGWKSAVHPDDVHQHVEKWVASAISGEPFENEARYRRAADGAYRWFLVRSVARRDEQGNILRWYGILADIEDRKQAEETLRRNQAFFAAEAHRIGELLRILTPGQRLEHSAGHEDATADDNAEVSSQTGPGAAGTTPTERSRLAAERRALESLTPNERAIMRLITEGKSNAEVGTALHLSPRTVETYRARLMEKLQLDNLAALVKFAIRHGLTSIE